MKQRIAAIFFLGAVMMCSAVIQAQGVYVIQGPNGPAFSDKPQTGAKEVTLRPLSVVPAIPEQKADPKTDAKADSKAAASPLASGDRRNSDAAPFVYRAFTVVSPEHYGSIVGNTGAFEVRVAVDPSLQLGERHSFIVSINGRTVDQRFTATEFMIPPEFWGDNLPPPNQMMQLDASIIDGNGQVLKMAAPVRFYLRYVTMMNRPHRPVRAPAAPPIRPATTPKLDAERGVGVISK